MSEAEIDSKRQKMSNRENLMADGVIKVSSEDIQRFEWRLEKAIWRATKKKCDVKTHCLCGAEMDVFWLGKIAVCTNENHVFTGAFETGKLFYKQWF